MTLTDLMKTYAAFIETTYPEGLSERDTIANCTLSWVGELNEWWEEEEDDDLELLEAGDVLYYMVKLLSTLGCDLDALTDSPLPPDSHAGRVYVDQIMHILTDATKKHLYYRPARYDREGYAAKIQWATKKTLVLICHSWTLGEIIEGNIKKLATRYNVPNPLEVPNESN